MSGQCLNLPRCLINILFRGLVRSTHCADPCFSHHSNFCVHLPSLLFLHNLFVEEAGSFVLWSFLSIGRCCFHPCGQVGHTPASCLFPPGVVRSGSSLSGILANCVTVYSPWHRGEEQNCFLMLSVITGTDEVTCSILYKMTHQLFT